MERRISGPGARNQEFNQSVNLFAGTRDAAAETDDLHYNVVRNLGKGSAMEPIPLQNEFCDLEGCPCPDAKDVMESNDTYSKVPKQVDHAR